MGKPTIRPARQSFKVPISASSLAVAPNGDVYLFGSPAYAIHRWDTQKTEKIQAPVEIKYGQLLGDDRIAGASYDYDARRDTAAIVDRATGKLVTQLAVSARYNSPNQVAVAPDGAHVAIAYGYLGSRSGIEIFAAETGTCTATIELDSAPSAITFSADGTSLLYFGENELSRMPIGGKRATSMRCEVDASSTQARVERRDGRLLLQWAGLGHRHPAYVVDEATGKIVFRVPEAEVAAFGPSPSTVVVATEADVTVLDFKGNVVEQFKRDRKTRFEHAGWNAHGFWFGVTSGGSFLEVFDLHRPTAVASSNPPPDKKRAPRRTPIEIAAKGRDADAGAKLRAAVWADPSDTAALRVYADWLAEQGSSQGEYILLALAKDATEDQQQRARTLLKQDRGRWLGAARDFVRSWSDSEDPPGFVERVWAEAPKVVAGFDKIVELGPRLELTITSMRSKRRETEKQLAKLALGRVARLDLSANALDDTSVATLAPAFRDLKSLRLDQNELTANGLDAIAPHANALAELSIQPKLRSGADVADAFVRAIARSSGFGKLAKLALRPMPGVEGPTGAALAELKRARPKLAVDVSA